MVHAPSTIINLMFILFENKIKLQSSYFAIFSILLLVLLSAGYKDM